MGQRRSIVSHGGGGGGGGGDVVVAFSSLARSLAECSTIHSSPALFFFFSEVEISSRTQIALFRLE